MSQSSNTPITPEERILSLERRRRRGWFLLLAVLFFMTMGYAASVFALLSARDAVPWPWPGSEPLLLVGLFIVQISLGYHLTRQQTLVGKLQAELCSSEHGAAQKTRRHEKHLAALNEAARTLADQASPTEVFESISRICIDTFDCRQVSLMLLEADERHLKVVAARGHLNPAMVNGARIQVGEGVAGWVAEHRTPIILGAEVDTGKFAGFAKKSFALSAAMVVPILVRNELVGVLNVSHRDPGKRYEEDDLQSLCVFSWVAAAAIRHAEHRSWMRQTIEDLEGHSRERSA